MIHLAAFALTCLLWQKFKNFLRGEKKPRIKLRSPGLRSVAECGCDLKGTEVVSPCQAHLAMMDV